jgi:hypothetical protein
MPLAFDGSNQNGSTGCANADCGNTGCDSPAKYFVRKCQAWRFRCRIHYHPDPSGFKAWLTRPSPTSEFGESWKVAPIGRVAGLYQWTIE